LPKYEYCRYRKILGNTGNTSIADIGRFWKILVIPVLQMILEDTGKILVLPVLCTSIVVPVSRPAASYYPTSLYALRSIAKHMVYSE
jgi:hypothetical protein